MKQNTYADIWVVPGAPGIGKTTIAKELLKQLEPTPALLDKDTMYGSFVSSILNAADKPNGEREGDWYDKTIKVHEYSGIIDTAREIRSHGCPVLLSAPFTQQIHSASEWIKFVDLLGGETVHLIWIETDAETLKTRLESRNSSRDTNKLQNFEAYLDYMQIDQPPPVKHYPISNRLKERLSLDQRVATLLADIRG